MISLVQYNVSSLSKIHLELILQSKMHQQTRAAPFLSKRAQPA